MNKWKKTITKTDCTTVERFMKALRKRGTFKGVEETTLKGGKKHWGKLPGEWITRPTVLSAIVVQWAADVQDGVLDVGWGDRAGMRSDGGGLWTVRDREVDGGENFYSL